MDETRPTGWFVFVQDDEAPEGSALIEAYNVEFEHGFLRVDTSDEYADGDGSAPKLLFYPAHRVIVIERLETPRICGGSP